MRDRLTPGLLAALGFVAAVGPFATDLYLPSFTDISRDLGAAAPNVQLTLTAFLLGLGVGQLFLGPASDRWGRRPVLVLALGVFAAASVVLVFSPHVAVFIALRAVQGFSGAAGVVIGRAIAVDLSHGATAVRALSLIAMVGALGPLVAPPIGGVVSAGFGWRGVLAVLALIATAMFLLALLVVPESLPPESRRSGGVAIVFHSFRSWLGDRIFVAYVVAYASGFAAMMAYISASPFVGQTVLGMGPIAYSLCFAAGAVSLVTANLVNARVAPRVGPRRLLAIGAATSAGAASLLAILTFAGGLVPATFVVCAFLLTGGTGLILANASALGLARAVSGRGAGAALFGATQFFAGGLASPLVGLAGEHSAVPMAVVCVAFSALALTATIVARRE
ncbi:MAG: multidrug effflux MFS transporter [Microbacterium sp.]|uniref:multidrug effflux MFS transporter n=1 Tax=Microbacterium sp. TaxID=51671 RepID=UPI0039E508C8